MSMPTTLAHHVVNMSAQVMVEEKRDIKAAYKYVREKIDEYYEQLALLQNHKRVLEIDYERVGGHVYDLEK